MSYELDNAWTPWERIVKAADKGTGLHLTSSEIQRLASDGAISSRAEQDSLERVNCECGLPIPAHRNGRCRKS